MKVLFYRYGSICEPDMIDAFQKIGLEVVEEITEITKKDLTSSDRVTLLEKGLSTHKPLFVFSINYYPIIAELCHIFGTLYLCWTVDSPVPELFSSTILHDTNRIFLFDRAQLRDFAPYNPTHLYHLPLYSAVERFDKVTGDISSSDRSRFQKDISFVGSLYNEKNPLAPIKDKLSDYSKGYIKALTEASLKVYGCNLLKDSLNETLITEIKQAAGDFYHPGEAVTDHSAYVVAHSYLGMDIACEERIRTLNLLAKFFDVHLYTRSDASRLVGVNVHPGVASLTEMPKIFRLSKINLNMTIRPIEEGLPLRIFDILGCGGFLMTNYQPELTDMFEIGVDLEAYGSMEELVDKCDYYLKHEDERKQIARNGYEKVCREHQYIHRIKKMLETI